MPDALSGKVSYKDTSPRTSQIINRCSVLSSKFFIRIPLLLLRTFGACSFFIFSTKNTKNTKNFEGRFDLSLLITHLSLLKHTTKNTKDTKVFFF